MTQHEQVTQLVKYFLAHAEKKDIDALQIWLSEATAHLHLTLRVNSKANRFVVGETLGV